MYTLSSLVTPVICTFILVIRGTVLETLKSVDGRHPEGMPQMSWKWWCSTWRFPVLLVMRQSLSFIWYISVPQISLAGMFVSQWYNSLAYGAFSSDNYLIMHVDCLCTDIQCNCASGGILTNKANPLLLFIDNSKLIEQLVVVAWMYKTRHLASQSTITDKKWALMLHQWEMEQPSSPFRVSRKRMA